MKFWFQMIYVVSIELVNVMSLEMRITSFIVLEKILGGFQSGDIIQSGVLELSSIILLD